MFQALRRTAPRLPLPATGATTGSAGARTPVLSLLALEPRTVFDAAAVATADQVADQVAQQQAEAVVEAFAEADGGDDHAAGDADDLRPVADVTQTRTEIAFVDGSVDDLGTLLAGIGASAEIVLIDPRGDGLAQIADALRDRRGVDAVHIVSHGDAGELHLGNQRLNQSTLASGRDSEFAAIRSALSQDADLLLYGCDVAAGAEGEAFLAALAAATGADVAASTDDTGSSASGGDWELESRHGAIETASLDAPEWNGILAPLNISVSAAPTTNGLTGIGAVGIWTDAGTVGGTPIDIRATVVGATAGATVQFATAYGADLYGPGRHADDMWLQVTGGEVTVRWEIFAAGTGQTITAVGDPNFRISDIDGNGAVSTPFPGIEIEAVSPSMNGLTGYTLDTPTNLVSGVDAGFLRIIGTANQNSESTSLVGFNWTNVSTWDVTYSATVGFGTRFFFHDGDGDFSFASPDTTYLLQLDLDGDDSTAPGNARQATYIENGAAVPVADVDATITQHAALGTQLHQASVRLANAQPGDQLLVNGSPQTGGSFNAGGATFDFTVTVSGGQIEVALTGTATPAQYQAALQAISFQSTSESPSAVDRQIEVLVTNTTFATSSNVAISTIHVLPVNDAPGIDLDGALPVSDGTLPATPPDNAWQVALYGGHFGVPGSIDPNATGPSGALGSPVLNGVGYAAAGSITFDDASIAPGDRPQDSIVAAGFSYEANPVNGDYVPGNGIWSIVMSRTLTQDATIVIGAPGQYFDDHAELFVNGVRVDAIIGWYPSLPAGEVMTYDASAGDVVEIRLTNVGNLGGFSVSLATAEQPNDLDHQAVFAEGDAPVHATLATKADAADLDDDITTLTIGVGGLQDGTSERIAIGGAGFPLDASSTQIVTLGATSFQVAYTPGSGFAITSAAGGTMLQADLDTLIRSITYENTSQDPTAGDRTLTFTATDAGGATSAPAVSTMTVVPVNDAPAGTDATLTAIEDTPYSFSPSDFGFTDADGNALLAVTVYPLAGSGTLSFAGAPVTAAIVIPAADIGLLVYTPAPDTNGSGLATFTFTVRDDGGTAGGGADTDPAPDTITFDVAAADDPVSAITPPAQTTPEDTPLVFSSANGNAIILTDPDGGNGGEVVVRLAVPATTGTLALGGTTGLVSVSGNGTAEIIVTGSVAAVNAALDGMTYTPTADWNGTVPSDLSITMTRPADVGFLNPGFEQPAFTGAPGANYPLEGTVPGWQTSASDDTFEIWESGFLGVPAFEGNQFAELNAFQVSTLSQSFTPTTAGGELTLTFAHRGRSGVDTMNVTAIDLGADGVLGGGDDVTLFSQDYATGNTAWRQYQADLGAATGNTILLQFDSISAAGGATVGNFLDAISIYDSSLSTSATVAITVSPVADAVDDTVTTDEDAAVTINVLTGANGAAADTFDNPARVVTAVTQGANGSVTFAADGTLTYHPNADFHGTDAFTYTVTSPAGITETATVTVTVDPVNDSPAARDDVETTSEDTVLSGQSVIADNGNGVDSDLDGDTLTVSQVNGTAVSPGVAVALPSGARLTMNADGTYSYDPNGAFEALGSGQTGSDGFTYQISDGNGGLATATVTIAIGGVNDAPAAAADTNAGTEQQTLAGNLLTGAITSGAGSGGADTDVDGNAITVTALSLGSVGAPHVLTHGTLTVQADGSYTFVPNATANALDQGQIVTEQITYTISDSTGGTAQATLTLTLAGQNDAPFNALAIPQTTAVDGGSLSFPTSGAFHDPDGEALSYSLAPAAPAWLAIDPATGLVSGSPPAAASQGGPMSNGTYAFAIIATDPHGASASADATVVVSNLAPLARDDAAVVGEDDATVTGNVVTDPATGDADAAPDHDPLTVVAAGQDGNAIAIGQPFTTAGGGTLTLRADGTYTFAPGSDYNGLKAGEIATETIIYTVSDGNGASDTALLVVTVTGANDAPVVVDPSNPGMPDNPTPAADPGDVIPDVAATDGAALTPIPVGDYVVDPDGEPLAFTLDPATTPAWLAIDPATGTITGTPPADASQHSNTANLGEYLLTVAATDPHGQTVTTTVTLAIANLAPLARDDAAVVGEDDAAVSGNVVTDPATGDADAAPDHDPLTVVAAGQDGNAIAIGQPFTTAGGGTLTLRADGTYTFAPGSAYNGLKAGEIATETIIYTVSDGNGASDTALLVVTVTGANDAPVGDDVVLRISQDQTVSSRIVASDPDGNSLTYGGPVSGPANGSVSVATDGRFSYAPRYGFSGTDRFTVLVDDGDGGTRLLTVTIIVRAQAVVHAVTDILPSGIPAGQGPPADLVVDGIILDAIGDIAPLGGQGLDLRVSGIVLNAVNGLTMLEGSSGPLDVMSTRGRPIGQIAELQRLAEQASKAFPLSSGHWDAKALAGFSIRMDIPEHLPQTASAHHQIVVDTLVRDRVVFVEISDTLAAGTDRRGEGYTVLQSDGRPLPKWVSRADDGLLLIEAPGDRASLELKIMTRSADGSVIARTVAIQLSTGEVQQLESTQARPPMLDEQIRQRRAN